MERPRGDGVPRVPGESETFLPSAEGVQSKVTRQSKVVQSKVHKGTLRAAKVPVPEEEGRDWWSELSRFGSVPRVPSTRPPSSGPQNQGERGAEGRDGDGPIRDTLFEGSRPEDQLRPKTRRPSSFPTTSKPPSCCGGRTEVTGRGLTGDSDKTGLDHQGTGGLGSGPPRKAVRPNRSTGTSDVKA